MIMKYEKNAEVASENFRVHNAGKLGLKNKKSEGANAHSENFESSPRKKIYHE